MKKDSYILSFIFLFLVPAFVFAESVNYLPRNLKIGDEGLDVYNLQVILNQDPDTKVSDSGVGSVGQETKYFGIATESAVKRFQSKNSEEILKPAGLSEPNGFVGPLTRALLTSKAEQIFSGVAKKASNTTSSALSGLSSVNSSNNTNSISSSLLQSPLNLLNTQVSGITDLPSAEGPILFPAESVKARPGKDARLAGFRLEVEENYDLIEVNSGRIFATAYASTSNALIFTPPKSWRTGEYSIYARDKEGFKTNTIKVFLSSDISPVIKDINPSPIIFGKEVKITADGLTDKDNSVVTNLGRIDNLVSKSGELKFISNFGSIFSSSIRDSLGTTTLKLSLRIVNNNGASDPIYIDVGL